MSAVESRPTPCFLLSEAQRAFLDATEPVRGFIGGQGAGKSKVGAYDLLMKTRPNRLYMVVAPTYSMLRDATFRTFREVAESIGLWNDYVKGEFTAFVRTRYGGQAEILFRSADNPDRLRGPNVSGVWLDEASFLKHEAFQIASARLREGGEAGWMTATFTPKGFSHWTYEVFGQRKPGVFLVHLATQDNPFLADDFLTNVEARYVGLRARQELGGEFVSVEGAEWPPEYFDYDGFWFERWPEDLALKVMACDPSMGTDAGGQDYQSHVLIGRGQDSYLYIDADLRRQTVTEMVQTGCELARQFGPAGFALETNQFQRLLKPEFLRVAQALRMESLPIFPVVNTVNKQVRIRRLTPYLSQQRLRFLKGSRGAAILVQQLRDFTGASSDMDDGPDALEMGIRLMTRLWQGKG